MLPLRDCDFRKDAEGNNQCTSRHKRRSKDQTSRRSITLEKFFQAFRELGSFTNYSIELNMGRTFFSYLLYDVDNRHRAYNLKIDLKFLSVLETYLSTHSFP